MAAFGYSILLISRTRFTFAFPKSPVIPFLSNFLHIKALSTTWNAPICRKSQFSFRVTFWAMEDTSNRRPQSIRVNQHNWYGTVVLVASVICSVITKETDELYSKNWSKLSRILVEWYQSICRIGKEQIYVPVNNTMSGFTAPQNTNNTYKLDSHWGISNLVQELDTL